MLGSWQIWVDRGGTFTDVVAQRPDGGIVTTKFLSEDPERYADAAVEAVRRLTSDADVPVDLRIGTTVATNALLERTGEPTVLAITRSFGDALFIGHQEHADIFATDVRRPMPIFGSIVEIDERIGADGTAHRALDLRCSELALPSAYERGFPPDRRPTRRSEGQAVSHSSPLGSCAAPHSAFTATA